MPKWWGPVSKILVSKASVAIGGLLTLILAFQNCNGTKFSSVQETILSSSVAETCNDSTPRSCFILNGVGAEYCNSAGNSLGCNVLTCDPGYLMLNNNCVPMACTPNSQTQCTVDNGSGTKNCSSTGNQYGPCVPNSCNPGYLLQNGSCVSIVCQLPGSQNCQVANGVGSQNCEAGNNGRNGWGACNPQSCNPGYILLNNMCMPATCTPGSTTECSFGDGSGKKTCTDQGIWGSCVLDSCSPNFHLDNGLCVANMCSPGSSANCQFGNGSGTYICNQQGSGYGACNLSSCDPGYNLQTGADGRKVCVANACTPSSQTSCTEGQGTGMKTCNLQGTGWGSCVIDKCNDGYNLQNGVCVANACTPGMPTNCSEANGSGTKVCNQQGTGYGSCVLNSCNQGYNFEIFAPNNRCVAQACTPNSTTGCSQEHGSGLKTCNSAGTGYGSCVLDQCESGYSLIGGLCVLNVCTPDSTASCSANHGSGSKTCNSQGTAYGSCVLNACDTGYFSEGVTPNLSCLPQVCQPNQASSCSVPNGTGTHTCNAVGSDYGSCTMVSCNEGFNPQNGQCVTNVCAPNSSTSCSADHGSGLKTCNAAGSAYGSCVLNSCDTGYFSQGATPNLTCSPQVCQPSTSAACPLQNGTGTKACKANGSGYESCVLVSCNDGYNNQNGVCVANVCTPNQASSCPLPNGTGSHTCNSTGSAYGVCNLVSCNSGYNNQNGICVPNVCAPNSSTSCSANHGSGTKTCNAIGSGYGTCVLNACDTGYYAQGSVPNLSCLPQVCEPNSSTGCAIPYGTGSKTCNAAGSGYGSCNLVSCNSGYNNQNGTCVANVCSPGTKTASGCTQPANGSSERTCNAVGSGYGSCTSSCDSGFTATGTQPNIACYGSWIQSQPASCSSACGQAAKVNSGAVTCSTSSCNPATKPQAITVNCPATGACPLVQWINKSYTCPSSAPYSGNITTNKTDGTGGSVGSDNDDVNYKMCANFQTQWSISPPDSSWIDSGLRDDSSSDHDLSEGSNDGSLQAYWIKSTGIGTSRWHGTGSLGCPAGWYDLKIWDDHNGRRDLCEGGDTTRSDNLCVYPMPAACDSVMLCAGKTFKVLNYSIPSTSSITTAQMDSYCNAHARGGINDYNVFGATWDHAGGNTSMSGNSQGAYYGSCFSKSAKSTGSRTAGPSGSSAFTCICN